MKGPKTNSPAFTRTLERVRPFVHALPTAEERISRNTPVFVVGGKQFAMVVDDHHGAANAGVWMKAADGLQPDLVRSDPRRFFVPPYLGFRGWVGVRIDARTDWKVVDGLLFDAFLGTAPKRVVESLCPSKRSAAERTAAFTKIRAAARGSQE